MTYDSDEPQPGFPRIDKDKLLEPQYSIHQIRKIVGKTIDWVEYGARESHRDVHQSEPIILYFTDGSQLYRIECHQPC